MVQLGVTVWVNVILGAGVKVFVRDFRGVRVGESVRVRLGVNDTVRVGLTENVGDIVKVREIVNVGVAVTKDVGLGVVCAIRAEMRPHWGLPSPVARS